MIKDMLQKQNVQMIDSISNWRDAIYLCTKRLIEQGYITERYPEAIIEITEKYGPYYVLCPNVALLHARPQDGVIKRQLAVLLLKNPVYFKDKEVPARLLITLAVQDSKSHIEAIQQIGELLVDADKIEEMLLVGSEEELYEKFISI